MTDIDMQKTEAVTRIAASIGGHQPVKREGLPGSTCRNMVCAAQGTILLTLGDIHRHQAVVAVNDLLSTLRFDREIDLDEVGVSSEEMEDDFTFGLLTDLLDASPAGRSYADRIARKKSILTGTGRGSAVVGGDSLGLFARFLPADENQGPSADPEQPES